MAAPAHGWGRRQSHSPLGLGSHRPWAQPPGGLPALLTEWESGQLPGPTLGPQLRSRFPLDSSHSHLGFSLAFPIHSLTTLRENQPPGDDFRKTTLSVPKPDGRPFGTAREPTGTGGQTAQARGSLSVLSLEGPSPARGTVSWSPVQVLVQTGQVQERASGAPPSVPPQGGGRGCGPPESAHHQKTQPHPRDLQRTRGGCEGGAMREDAIEGWTSGL